MAIVQGAIILVGNYPEGNCPGTIFLGENCSGTNIPGGIVLEQLEEELDIYHRQLSSRLTYRNAKMSHVKCLANGVTEMSPLSLQVLEFW